MIYIRFITCFHLHSTRLMIRYISQFTVDLHRCYLIKFSSQPFENGLLIGFSSSNKVTELQKN